MILLIKLFFYFFTFPRFPKAFIKWRCCVVMIQQMCIWGFCTICWTLSKTWTMKLRVERAELNLFFANNVVVIVVVLFKICGCSMNVFWRFWERKNGKKWKIKFCVFTLPLFTYLHLNKKILPRMRLKELDHNKL